MVTDQSQLARRLAAQMLSGEPASHPVAEVERLLAVQGQDLQGSRLAIRARSRDLNRYRRRSLSHAESLPSDHHAQPWHSASGPQSGLSLAPRPHGALDRPKQHAAVRSDFCNPSSYSGRSPASKRRAGIRIGGRLTNGSRYLTTLVRTKLAAQSASGSGSDLTSVSSSAAVTARE